MRTTIGIYLPASQEAVLPVQQQRHTPPDMLIGGSGRILALDDEDLIRDMRQAMLSVLGYDVTCVGDDAEAITKYRDAWAEGEPYAAVILDLTLPGGMGGQEVLAHLRELDPEVKALASSGYADDPVMANHAQDGFQGTVPKPCTVETLSTVLQRVLPNPPEYMPIEDQGIIE